MHATTRRIGLTFLAIFELFDTRTIFEPFVGTGVLNEASWT